MTILKPTDYLVSPHWLLTHLQHPQLIVLDASLNSAIASSKDWVGEESLAIPGTQIFDFDKKICDRESSLPHMMPSPALFTQEVRALGINRNNTIVVYDRMGIYSSPRAWWMFKAMGHERVAVLDGGLPAWLSLGMPCQPRNTNQTILTGDFLAKPRPGFFCDGEHVLNALADVRYAILDARSERRFLGVEAEPRAGLRAGHMPNAQNLPFKAVQAGNSMKTNPEINAIFAPKASYQQKLILSCGSGVTACILALAATLAGYPQITVYDGSWSEWGLPSPRPVVR